MKPTLTLIVLLLMVGYILINIIVTKKIDKAFYIKEERRKLHKKLIWIIPFFGPLLIRSHWQKKKKNEVMTKDKRDSDGGSFRESGAGMYPVD